MSDTVSLEFIGEQMLQMQGDLRTVWSDQARLEKELHGLDGKVDRLEVKVDAVDAKVDAVDAKVTRFMSSVDARFDLVHQTMSTNLAVTLKAIEHLSESSDARLKQLSESTDVRFKQLSESTDARFTRFEETAEASLQTVLKAIDDKLG